MLRRRLVSTVTKTVCAHCDAFPAPSIQRSQILQRIYPAPSWEGSRLFSSQNFTEDTDMVKSTNQLLRETPLGTFDPSIWWNAEDQLVWWTEQKTPLSVQMSLLLLSRLVDEQQIGNESVSSDFLDWQIIDRVVENWAEVQDTLCRKTDDSVISARPLLDKLDYYCTTSPTLELSGTSLQFILGVVTRRAKRMKSVSEAALAEHLLDRMIELIQSSASSRGSFHPRTKALNKVLSSWTACARPDRAHALFERVQNTIPLDSRSYNCLLAAYAKVGNGEAAEQLLEDMCEQWQLQEGYPLLDWKGGAPKPDVVSWNTVLSAWAKSNASDAGERVQALLARMYDPKTSPPVQADIKTFNTVLACWARGGQADRCRALLEKMKEFHASGELHSPPDLFSYATVTNACAKASRPEQAQELVDEVYSLFMDGRKEMKPSLTLLTTLMDAWSRAGNVDQTRLLFRRINDLYHFGFLDSGPDTAAYNIMLAALFYWNDRTANAGEEAEELLQEMKKSTKALPNFFSYAMVIQILLLQDDGLHRATELVWEAMELCRDNSFEEQPEHMQVKAVLLAFTKADQPQIAQDILLTICKLAMENRVEKPRIDLFGLVFSAWDRSNVRDAALKADKLVQDLLHFHRKGIAPPPDFPIYYSVLSCWTKSRLPMAPERALSMVMGMRARRLQQGGKIDLNASMYNRVLELCLRNCCTIQAYDLLLTMHDDYVNHRSTAIPRIGTYKTIMWAIARSEETERTQKIDLLLRNMERLGLIPDVDAYNSLLYSWLTSGDLAAVGRIQELIEEMKALHSSGVKNVFPNGSSYEFWVEAVMQKGDISKAGSILVELWTMFNEGRFQKKPDSKLLDVVEKSLGDEGYDDIVRLIQAQRDSDSPKVAM